MSRYDFMPRGPQKPKRKRGKYDTEGLDPKTGLPRMPGPSEVRPGDNPLLPSDFPDPPKGMPPVPDFVKQLEQQRNQAGLRQRLEEKKTKGRKNTAMRDATSRRRSRGGGRSMVFKDPANLRAYLSKQQQGTGTVDSGQPQDMDDTIIKGDDGQTYRYDAEIDGFTPVKFDPAKNKFDFDDQGAGAAQKSASDATKERQDQQAAAMSESKSNFERQLADLRRMADDDPQFGTMYREYQDEYLSLMQDQSLRPEERDAALSDLYQRGTSTFDATSSFRRAAEEQKEQAAAEQKRQKALEGKQYRDQRAQEQFNEIRRNYSKTVSDAEVRKVTPADRQKAYDAYAKEQKDYGEEAMSYQEYRAQQMLEEAGDQKAARQMAQLERDISVIDVKIDRIEDMTDEELREEFTATYGQGNQGDADAAFERFRMKRNKDLADLKGERAAREQGMEDIVTARLDAETAQKVAGSGKRMEDARARLAADKSEVFVPAGGMLTPGMIAEQAGGDRRAAYDAMEETKKIRGEVKESRLQSLEDMTRALDPNDPYEPFTNYSDADENAPVASRSIMRGAAQRLAGLDRGKGGKATRSSKNDMRNLRNQVKIKLNNERSTAGLSGAELEAQIDEQVESLIAYEKRISSDVRGTQKG